MSKYETKPVSKAKVNSKCEKIIKNIIEAP